MKREAGNIRAAWSLVLLLLLLPFQGRAESVVGSLHDLSVSGTGSIRAASATGACVFCHTPHGGNAQTPLWNHGTSKATYILYSSTTMVATVGQPNGASALCLSCHDGTVALGMVNSLGKPIQMQGGATVLPANDPTNLGTNLSQDHPISFVFNSHLATQAQLVDPSALTGAVKLDGQSQVQCTSCHDPHNDQFGSFLVMDNSGSALCTTCHLPPDWTGSAHHLSAASLKSAVSQIQARGAPHKASALPDSAVRSELVAVSQIRAQSGAKTVGANACNNCHTSHKAAGRQQLLLSTRQEQTCFACHNGTVVRQNIEAELAKVSVHPVLQSTPASDSVVSTSRTSMIKASSQVTCSDCHNSHAAKKSASVAPDASGPILGVKGMTKSGGIANPIRFEYELCFRCHGDKPVSSPDAVDRNFPQPNTRLAFSSANRSYHPVVERGTNPRVPSLIMPYTAASLIKCTDCHNNNQGPGAGGTGPRGPHGSAFVPLLERQLITRDYINESVENYALCYKCHNRESILSDQSFRAINSQGRDCGHRFHIVDQKTACTTCHDSHGVALNQHLINFNPDFVTPANGRIAYNSIGTFRGNCTLTCHGYAHIATAYPTLMIHPAPAAKTPARPMLAPPMGANVKRLF